MEAELQIFIGQKSAIVGKQASLMRERSGYTDVWQNVVNSAHVSGNLKNNTRVGVVCCGEVRPKS